MAASGRRRGWVGQVQPGPVRVILIADGAHVLVAGGREGPHRAGLVDRLPVWSLANGPAGVHDGLGVPCVGVRVVRVVGGGGVVAVISCRERLRSRPSRGRVGEFVGVEVCEGVGSVLGGDGDGVCVSVRIDIDGVAGDGPLDVGGDGDSQVAVVVGGRQGRRASGRGVAEGAEGDDRSADRGPNGVVDRRWRSAPARRRCR